LKDSRALAAALLLAAITLLTFSGALGNGFVHDDEQYVTTNPGVRGGLSREGVAWAFTSFDHANWHPLTWLSHQADVELFGLTPRGHHLTGLLVHAANAALLLVALARLTGSPAAAAAAAALFALHPLRVESAAWIAERKDVLSLLFALLALLAYHRYARRPDAPRYGAVLALFALGLMAKPMLVTLPLLLLLLDWWPLGRFAGGAAVSRGGGRRLPSPLAEKVPLLALSAVSALVTYLAQSHGGAVGSSRVYPVLQRLANVPQACLAYLSDTFWPSRLAVFYPFPAAPAPGKAILAAAILLGLTLLAARLARAAPFVLAGWLWFLCALVPVIGLIQVGDQARADRYTYLPSIGLAVAAAWGTQRLARRLPSGRALLAVAATLVLTALIVATRAQVRVWKDEGTLFARALEVAPESWLAHANYGKVLLERGQVTESLGHLRQAARLNPQSPQVQLSLGAASLMLGNPAEAVAAFTAALRLRPESAAAHNNLGLALARLGRDREAIGQFREALRLNPTYAEIHLNLGDAYAGQGAHQAAADSYREALRLNPVEARARSGLARLGAHE
jgi:tetratricopeptide (TPR) repeat protein